MMDIYMITGASRCLGYAVSKQLLGKNNLLFCVSRTPDKELAKESERICLPFDLSKVGGITALMDRIFDYLKEKQIIPGSFTLINNVGVVEPIKPS